MKKTHYDKQSLQDQVVIVTGGNSGIGYYTVLKSLQEGAHVIMASRSLQRAEEAKLLLKKQTSIDRLTILELDVSSLDSVHSFVSTFLSRFKTLDILVNNAGIMFGDYQRTKDGFERQMATNHFGHFALTGLLMPVINPTRGRIIQVSSIAHQRAVMDLNDLHYEGGKGYTPWGAYSRSKLANLWFAYALDERLKAQGSRILSLVVHPGVSKTNLFFKEKGKQPLYNILKVLMPLQSAEKGALPTIRAMLDKDALSGDFFGPSGFGQFSGASVRVKATELANNRLLAKQFFDVSETLTKVNFFR
jgi:NAD(P)-dependent dehydrogenase (short-subunit alcohol dehydrogenase family)